MDTHHRHCESEYCAITEAVVLALDLEACCGTIVDVVVQDKLFDAGTEGRIPVAGKLIQSHR